MIAGIIWKVEALPTPVAKNNTRNIAKKPQNAPGWSLMPRKNRTPPTAAIITAKTHKVTRAPPQRSAIQPVAARDRAPINGPKKMKGSEFTSGNWVLASSGKPAE